MCNVSNNCFFPTTKTKILDIQLERAYGSGPNAFYYQVTLEDEQTREKTYMSLSYPGENEDGYIVVFKPAHEHKFVCSCGETKAVV